MRILCDPICLVNCHLCYQKVVQSGCIYMIEQCKLLLAEISASIMPVTDCPSFSLLKK